MTHPPYLLVDAHEDLAWNMLTFGRDYTRTVPQTRSLEARTQNPEHNGDTLLGWDAYQRGRVALVFATLFNAPMRKKDGEWDTQCYTDARDARTLYRQHLDTYHRLADEHPDRFRLITSQPELAAHLDAWHSAPGWVEAIEDQDSPAEGEEDSMESERPPVGLVMLMEGAEGVLDVEELPAWWAAGVRIIGPAWLGNRYCGGTDEPGPLTNAGYELLEAMADLGFILDLSHMDAQAALQSLDAYPGKVIASHANPLGMMPGEESNRFLPDDIIQGLIERDGVIGIVPYNRFLDPNWVKGMRRELVSLERVVAHIDYICQMAGDSRHAGIGTDFDGGLRWQHVPREINTIADLQLLAPMLVEKGYREEDVARIFGQNWLGVLQSALPEAV